MNRDNDLDDVMRAWVDAGEDRLPPRNLRLALEAIEQTPQRNPRSIRGLFMTALSPAAVPLTVVTFIVAVAAFVALLGGRSLGEDEDLTSSPSVVTSEHPAPSVDARATPRVITADTLRRLTYGGSEIVMGLDPALSLEGRDALGVGLRADAAPSFDPEGFVDARYDEFAGNVNHDARNPGVIGTYALLLETAEAAEEAYRFLVEHHESPDGWGLEPDAAFREAFGDQGVSYRGPAYDRGDVTVFLWRADRLVLMAIGMEGTEYLQPLFVARRMDDQLR